jgi:hypothetical protein
MTKRLIVMAVVALLCACFGTVYGAVYQQTVDVYQYSVGGTISWSHTYDHSADPIAAVTLTITADDVDGPGSGADGEQDYIYVRDRNSTWHLLGMLTQLPSYTNWGYYAGPGNPNQPLTTTTFAIDPTWLDGLPVETRVESSWGVEIETSTLTVTSETSAVPEPATLFVWSVLGAVSLIAVWRQRKAA